MNWKPIAEAPKDRLILAWCDHEADPFYEDELAASLTAYAAFHEIYGHAPTGYHLLEWGGAFDERTYECPDGGYMPDWWFVAGSDFEKPANPILWLDIDFSNPPTKGPCDER